MLRTTYTSRLGLGRTRLEWTRSTYSLSLYFPRFPIITNFCFHEFLAPLSVSALAQITQRAQLTHSLLSFSRIHTHKRRMRLFHTVVITFTTILIRFSQAKTVLQRIIGISINIRISFFNCIMQNCVRLRLGFTFFIWRAQPSTSPSMENGDKCQNILHRAMATCTVIITIFPMYVSLIHFRIHFYNGFKTLFLIKLLSVAFILLLICIHKYAHEPCCQHATSLTFQPSNSTGHWKDNGFMYCLWL